MFLALSMLEEPGDKDSSSGLEAHLEVLHTCLWVERTRPAPPASSSIFLSSLLHDRHLPLGLRHACLIMPVAYPPRAGCTQHNSGRPPKRQAGHGIISPPSISSLLPSFSSPAYMRWAWRHDWQRWAVTVKNIVEQCVL